MFWIIIILIFVFYFVDKNNAPKKKEDTLKEATKQTREKAEHYIQLNKWRVKDGDCVSDGDVIASIALVTQVGELKMVDLARNLRADGSGYLKHQVKEGRLGIPVEYPDDPKLTSFNMQDIAVIEDSP